MENRIREFLELGREIQQTCFKLSVAEQEVGHLKLENESLKLQIEGLKNEVENLKGQLS